MYQDVFGTAVCKREFPVYKLIFCPEFECILEQNPSTRLLILFQIRKYFDEHFCFKLTIIIATVWPLLFLKQKKQKKSIDKLTTKYGYYNIIYESKQLYRSEKSCLVQWDNSTTLLAVCNCSQSLCLTGFSQQLLSITLISLTFCYTYINPYIILDKRLMELCRDINLPYFPISRYQKKVF